MHTPRDSDRCLPRVPRVLSPPAWSQNFPVSVYPYALAPSPQGPRPPRHKSHAPWRSKRHTRRTRAIIHPHSTPPASRPSGTHRPPSRPTYGADAPTVERGMAARLVANAPSTIPPISPCRTRSHPPPDRPTPIPSVVAHPGALTPQERCTRLPRISLQSPVTPGP